MRGAMTAPTPPDTKKPPVAPTRIAPACRRIWAATWRFALAGPPIGTALFILPMLLLSSLDVSIRADEVIGSWLFFSIFAYAFAGPAAAIAGAVFGWLTYATGHNSRWGLGALAGTLGWLVQIGATALWKTDISELNAVLFLPIALIAGGGCGRLFGQRETPVEQTP
ncbi:hypothetical protein T5B8_07203 [Salinisphaera sp. T5B8]